MKKTQGGIIPVSTTTTDNRTVVHEGHYYVSEEAIEKYGVKLLNAINKGEQMHNALYKEDPSDGSRIDSCEECSDFEDIDGVMACTHEDSPVNIINPVTYTYEIPKECPLEDWYCTCRHPECTDCYPRDTRTKHGLKDHEMTLLVNAVRDAVQPYTKLQCTREIVSKAVVRYLEANDLRIDKRGW